MKRHLFKMDNRYYLIDGEMLNLYKLNNRFFDRIQNLEDEEIYKTLQNMKLSTENKTKLFKADPKTCKRLILNMTSNCNLSCKYCYASYGTYGVKTNEKFMSEQTLCNTLKKVLKMYPKGIDYIQFFGGEPLLNKRLMTKSIQIISEICDRYNVPYPKYTIVTNGTILDDDYINMFNEYFTSVTISLDGDKQVNDKCRIFSNSDNSVYDIIIDNIRKLNENDRKFYLGIESTITKYHIEDFILKGYINSLETFKNLELDFYTMSPAFDNYDSKLTIDEYPENVVMDFFDMWTKQFIENTNTEELKFKRLVNIIRIFQNKTYYKNSCGAAETDIAVDINGNIYPCFLFIDSNEYLIGNVNKTSAEELITRRKEINNKLSIAFDSDKCQNCWANKFCSNSYGHCIGARYILSNNIHEPHNYACEIGKKVIERTVVQAIENFKL